MVALGVILVLFGAVSLWMGIGNYDAYLQHPRARWVTEMLGRGGARWFYIGFGLTLVTLGVLMGTELIDPAQLEQPPLPWGAS